MERARDTLVICHISEAYRHGLRAILHHEVDVASHAISDAAHSRNFNSCFNLSPDNAKFRRHTALLNVKVVGHGAAALINLDLIVRSAHTIVAVVRQGCDGPIVRREHRRAAATPEVPRVLLETIVGRVVVMIKRGVVSLNHPGAFAAWEWKFVDMVRRLIVTLIDVTFKDEVGNEPRKSP